MHSCSNCTHIDTRVHTNVALSCVQFLMFGVETRAAQPLKTGDNICPPSLSVLPSIMVRPLSPLRFFILPSFTPLPFFLPPPPHLFSSAHLPHLPSRAKSSTILLRLSFFPLQPFLYSLSFFKKTYSSFSPSLTLLCAFI